MSVLGKGTSLQNGKYKVVKTLGQGSFGITYLASTPTVLRGSLANMAADVNVTIKEFFMSEMSARAKDGLAVEQTGSSLVGNYRRKFIREAENLSHLHHDNIVKVSEVFEENNTAYYVMEYVDGGTIDQLIACYRRLNVPQTVAIVRQVCQALQYMHANMMLHLDLKPKNIMVNSAKQVKLIDFGLSKQYNDKGEPEESTSVGLGTPGYAPIEQAQYRQDGSMPVTLDVYALGGTMFKMLTGITPPEASSVLNDGLPVETMAQAGVPPRMIEIVCKAMAPMRRERYQSVAELETELRSLGVNEALALEGIDLKDIGERAEKAKKTKMARQEAKTVMMGSTPPPPPPPHAGRQGGATPPTPPPMPLMEGGKRNANANANESGNAKTTSTTSPQPKPNKLKKFIYVLIALALAFGCLEAMETCEDSGSSKSFIYTGDVE